ncbi:MAG: HlyD family efflux transporter periplasmic adaptor subunit [Cyanobium sp. PLM2.Bin73]|nr:MAG: HlyD family efflux transporter periplasmic adaptor subunit [Cyanobium sp. PLM2.Bin73]
MIGSFVVGLGLMAVWPYRVVVRGMGEIRPSGETSMIHAPLAGRLRVLRVRSNQTVQEGEVIAELDPADLESKREELADRHSALERQQQAVVQQSEAAVAAAREEVAKAQATLNLAETEYQRFSQLVLSGAIAPLQLEEKRANLAVARSNLTKAEQTVQEVFASQQAELSRLAQDSAAGAGERAQVERNLALIQVRAPVSGVLYSLSLRNPQQVVAEGQALAQIAPSGRELVARVLVRSEDINNLEIGQRADLRISGCPFPDFGTLKGQVNAIEPDAVSGQVQPLPRDGAPPVIRGEGSGMYAVNVQPDAPALVSGSRRCELKMGMDVQGDITTRVDTVLSFLLRKARLISGQ